MLGFIYNISDLMYNISMKKSKIKAEKREIKKKTKMLVSGKSVFKLQEIIIKKSQNKHAKQAK